MAADRPTLQLLAGAAMISFAPVFVKLVSLAPTASAFYRTAIGGVVLIAWVATRTRAAVARSRTAWLFMAAAGVLFAADLAAWHRSIWYIGPGLATLLGNFQVFVLALVGVFVYGERARPRLWLAIFMALAGLVLIVGTEWSALEHDYRWGVIFGLLTALAYAAYILALRRARQASPQGSAAADLGIISLLTAVVLFASASVGGDGIPLPNTVDASLLAGYALVAQVFGWLLISRSLPRVPASRAGLALLLQPTLAFVWDVLFFATPFSARQVAGAVLAIAAIGIGSRRA
jgi:drug/metabolite transporter (DMT)-like permease